MTSGLGYRTSGLGYRISELFLTNTDYQDMCKFVKIFMP